MSLPHTECAVPPGEHASVNVSPSLPFSDVAFASQVVGVPLPEEDGKDGPGFALSGEVFVWPPPPVFSFLSFEHAALTSTIAASKSTTQRPMIRRSSRNSDSWNCGSCVACVDRYDGVT